MVEGVYCEFLKLKRTGYFWSILAVSLIITIFVNLNKDMVKSLNWYGYFYHFEVTAFTIFYTIIIPIMISFIFTREFGCKTASLEFSYPNGRFGAFINKFITSIIVIISIYIIGFILIILSGIILLKVPLSVEPLINHLKVFGTSLIFQVLIAPLTMIIALIGKRISISFFYSIMLLMFNFNYVVGAKYTEYMFSILPAAPVIRIGAFIYESPIDVNLLITKTDICLGSFIFFIGTSACILFYKKANIY